MPTPPAKTTQPWSMQGGVTRATKDEAQRFARSILNSQQYRDWLQERITNKNLDSSIERMLWAYGWGKPVEHVQLTVSQGAEDLSQLSVQELFDRAKKLSDALEEAQQLEASLPAEFKVTA